MTPGVRDNRATTSGVRDNRTRPHLHQLSSSSRCLKAWAPLSSSHVTKEKTRMGRGSVACLSLPGATAVGFEPRLPGSRVCVLYQQQY